MDARELTFGIEIETHVPAGAVVVGPYHRGVAVPGLPEGWTAQHDCSIRPPRGRQGCEFVSPVLKGAEGVRSVIAALAAIRQLGARVNDSCGLHVHVGFNVSDSAALNRLVTLVANFEKAIYASTGTRKRERSHYCAGIQQSGNLPAAMHGSTNRYRILNLSGLLHGGKPTVEFRAFAGTLNADKILGYLRLCLGLVERAGDAKRTTKWTAKRPVVSSPIHRSGEGQTELTRLYYQLGWTQGRTKRVYGGFEAEGPTLKRIKRELMRMARKYDGQR